MHTHTLTQGHATDAATNTEDCPVGPSPCSSSSSLASLLLSHEGGRAGSIGGIGSSSKAGSGSAGGKTRTAPEEVPTSEIDVLVVSRCGGCEFVDGGERNVRGGSDG